MKRLSLLLAGMAICFAFQPGLAAENVSPAGPGPDSWVGDLSPISKADWNFQRAGHLLERAGFGGTPEEIEKLAKMTPEEAVNSLVDYSALKNDHLPRYDESGIFAADEYPILYGCPVGEAIRLGMRKGESLGIKVQRKEGTAWLQPIVDKAYYHVHANRMEIVRVEVWWANRMLNTKRPLEEKLTLFWHGHFATSSAKVRDYRLMLIQLDMLRRNATGSFRDLLLGIAKDPAMLVYLDNGQNVKGASNENFAREVMELFSMGVGNYTEKDIREAARAFTGWTNDGLKFVIKPELHDTDAKTVLGKTGNFDGTDVIDIILEQKVTAEYMAGKIYRFFVRDELSGELQTKLAGELRAGKYELKPFLKTMLLSKDFYSPASYGTQIKSPVHLAVSTYKKLGLTEIPGIPDFRAATRDLGQELTYPPNVAGWEGGPAWINPATMLERGNFARQIFFADAATFRDPDRLSNEQLRRIVMRNQAMEKKDGKEGEKKEERTSAVSKLSTTSYNLAEGVFKARSSAQERVKPIARAVAVINLTAMVKEAKVATVEEAVDYFTKRFLRVSPSANDRQILVNFLQKQVGADKLDYDAAKKEALEKSLRLLLHMIMSLPEYQLA